MAWLLKRVLAGLAALLVVAVGAGALLGAQFSGDPAPWAASQGSNAAWLSGAWVKGGKDRDDFATLLSRIEEGELTELYVHVADIGPDGGSDPADYAEADAFLEWAGDEIPDVNVLGWMEHSAEGSSLVRDRFDEPARDAVAASAGEVLGAGFDGVHLAVSPVTTNDPSLPDLLARTREEIGDDAMLSVQAQSVEPVAGARLPVFVVARGEMYWSKGYLRRVAEPADMVVVSGHGTGMPMSPLYGGFVVRQTKEALAALEPLSDRPSEGEEAEQDGGAPAVRFGLPSYESEAWGPVSGAESVRTAVEGVRLGLTEHGRRDGADVGVALYVLDDTDEEDWTAFTEGWVAPER